MDTNVRLILYYITGRQDKSTRSVASSSAYGSGSLVWLRRVEDGRLLNVLIGHEGSIYGGVAFSPDGKMLASGSRDETVRLWRVRDGELLHTLEGHTSTVQGVAFSPDGGRPWPLALTTVPCGCGRWASAPTCPQSDGCGRLLRTLEGHSDDVRGLAFSPDGTLLASGGLDYTLRLWGVVEGE